MNGKATKSNELEAIYDKIESIEEAIQDINFDLEDIKDKIVASC
jgi:uncharacterized protein (UPF0335 family)